MQGDCCARVGVRACVLLSTAHATDRRRRYGMRHANNNAIHAGGAHQGSAPLYRRWRPRACATAMPCPSTANVATAWRYSSRPHACQPWQQRHKVVHCTGHRVLMRVCVAYCTRSRRYRHWKTRCAAANATSRESRTISDHRSGDNSIQCALREAKHQPGMPAS